jgi:hypothetical protein
MKGLAWRLLAGCLIAVLGACTGAAAPSSRSTPAPVAVGSAASTRPPPTAMPNVAVVVTGYYRAIVTRNYRRASGYLAPGVTGPDGRKLTLRSFLQLAHMLDGMGGPVTRFSVEASPFGVVMTLYRARYGPYHAHLQMVRAGHGWAISSIDRI